ncbi:MAG TPA: methylmalonyl-CoA mutase, partial [Proteobacteria bacterium]|nr:methylmalonyl-CoA mutase [Pseudomonadota bacterium]
KDERKRWEETTLKKALDRFPERKERFTTVSGIEIDRLYTPEHIEDVDYLRDLGFPGEYPFTRGVQPTMYRGRFWTFRQYSGFGSAEDTNRRFKYLLEHGQTGLSIAFDLPTQMGYDSDHPMASGEVGKVGVAIDSLEDMETLFDGIPLDKVTTSMTINSTAAVLLAMYLAIAEKQGVPFDKLGGTIQNDVLKEYVARGTYIFPPEPSMKIVTDIFEFCSKNVPRWNTISVSGYHIREAGANAAQEVAFTLANGIAYVDAAIKAGLDVDQFARRISFFFNSHLDFFEEIAKFRAARRLWAKIMKDRFGAKKPQSMMLRFHTQTAGCTLTAQQPENNIVRVALQALAAVLGGTQSLHTNSYDEAFCLPTEQAVKIALRTQQLIAYESGVADVVDPLAGSYYIEWLTDQIERRAAEYIEKIDKMGGVVKAIEQGYIQKEIQDESYRYQLAVEKGDRKVVGVNIFTEATEPLKDVLKVDPKVEQDQCAKLKRLRDRRDNAKVRDALAKLEAACASGDNIMPPMIEAVKAYATIGEVSD